MVNLSDLKKPELKLATLIVYINNKTFFGIKIITSNETHEIKIPRINFIDEKDSKKETFLKEVLSEKLNIE